MSFKFKIAKASAGLARFVLQKVLKRPGGFYPGKVALKIDKNILSELSGRFDAGSILVTGTNGKTSVTALIANCAKFEGKQVAYNKTGANLASGVATAILEFNPVRRTNKLGVFEVDELWVSEVLSQLKSKYLLLLNLFPDQLDRFGSIENIQKSLIDALNKSRETILVYNADDPNCQIVADECENSTIPFGVNEKISKTQDIQINNCPICKFEMNYKINQYAQLGIYRCPNCGFNRANVKYGATDIELGLDSLKFKIGNVSIETKKAAEYVCYNLTGFVAVVNEFGFNVESIIKAIKTQNTDNGRMQEFEINDQKIVINLAKNPVGFNQNINYIYDRYISKKRPSNTTVAFFVNAREGDGKNTNWLYEVNFSKLASLDNMNIYYGGEAYKDVLNCFKDSHIVAHRVENAKDLLDSAKNSKTIYIVANYTAMFLLRDELLKM